MTPCPRPRCAPTSPHQLAALRRQLPTLPRPRVEEYHLFRRYARRPSPALRNAIVERYRHLASEAAARAGWRAQGVADADDLEQAGVLGLIQAVESFDHTRGWRFETFAARRVRGAVLDHLRQLDPLGRRARAGARKLAGLTERLAARLMRRPSNEETVEAARETGCAHTLRAATEGTPRTVGLGDRVISCDRDGDNDAGGTVGATLADRAAPDPADAAAARDGFNWLLRGLAAAERAVLRCVHVAGMSQAEAARELGQSESTVSTTLRRAADWLRYRLTGQPRRVVANVCARRGQSFPLAFLSLAVETRLPEEDAGESGAVAAPAAAPAAVPVRLPDRLDQLDLFLTTEVPAPLPPAARRPGGRARHFAGRVTCPERTRPRRPARRAAFTADSTRRPPAQVSRGVTATAGSAIAGVVRGGSGTSWPWSGRRCWCISRRRERGPPGRNVRRGRAAGAVDKVQSPSHCRPARRYTPAVEPPTSRERILTCLSSPAARTSACASGMTSRSSCAGWTAAA